MEKYKRIIAFDIAVCAALVISCVISAFSSLESTCENIKDNVFRLHIIANSDSGEDQALKLKVRDAVLEKSGSLYENASSLTQAQKITLRELDSITEIAQSVIKENGFNYNVKAEIGESYFPTREYENFTLPAGKYKALRIILGEGEGHNWWCVMFPPMCLGAAEKETQMLDDVLNESSVELISSGKKYEIKFKVIEWYEGIKQLIEEKRKEK